MNDVIKFSSIVVAALAALGPTLPGVGQCIDAPEPNATIHSASGVFVQWVGPVGVRPQCDTDFDVDSSEPPNVTLKTLTKLVADIEVQIQQYIVGRTFGGGTEPRHIRSVKSAWASWQENPSIIVRIGTVAAYPVNYISATAAPESIAVDIKAPPVVNGNDPWSSVEIKTTPFSWGTGGNVQGSVLVEANSVNKGGRVHGDIAGKVGVTGAIDIDDPRIDAYTVGQGEQGPGTLKIAGELVNARFKEFPDGARVQAAKMATISNIVIQGPLNGQMRFGELMGVSNQSQPAKIIVEALDFSDEDPLAAPRLASSGRITVAGGDLSVDPWCPGCPTVVSSGEMANSEIRIDGDLSGQIRVYRADTNGTDDKAAKVKVGRSMARSEMQGHLLAGGEIRSFEGNYSTPAIEGSLQFMHVDVYGDTNVGSTIECGGQLNQASFINIHRDHKGVVQVLYFYGNFAGDGNAQVHVFGDMYGIITSVNTTDDRDRSCFRDNGTITVDGEVKAGAFIILTGNVGPGHLTEVFGDFNGSYVVEGFAHQKKYAGRIRIHGSLGGNGIAIRGSLDSKRLGLIEMKGADIQIDRDVNAPIILAGINNPPCLWTEPGSTAPGDGDCVGQGNNGACSPSPNCTGEFAYLNTELCCVSCSCVPPPHPSCDEVPEPPECCLDQTMEFWEDGIQHPGALVDGKLVIGGKLTSSIGLAGDIGPLGSIRIGSIEGGSISLASGAGIQSGGSITVLNGFLSGLIEIPGNVSGSITIGSLGPSTGGGATQATIAIGGQLASTLDIRGQMHNALISVGSGATASRINLGTASTAWTLVDGGSSSYIDIGDMNWSGGSGTTITFRGTYTPPANELAAPRSICWGNPAGIVVNLISGEPMPAAICLP